MSSVPHSSQLCISPSAGVLTLVLHAQLALTRCGSEALQLARAKLDLPYSVCKVKWRMDGTSITGGGGGGLISELPRCVEKRVRWSKSRERDEAVLL